MFDPTSLVRELRLMRDQPNHRFYALCLLVVLMVVVLPVLMAVLWR
jgi:hypothetical protein